MPSLGKQSVNTTRDYQIELSAPTGGTLLGLFTGSETFTAKLWPGSSYASLATLTAVWDSSVGSNPSGIAKPVIKLSIPTATIASITPGNYAVQIIESTTKIEMWEGSIELTASDGATALPVMYCTPQDMVGEASWATELQDLGPGAATNFIRERAAASRWVDRQVMARRERDLRSQAERNNAITATDPITPTTGYDRGPAYGPSSIPDTTIRTDLASTQTLLDAGKLILDPPTIRLATLWTLYLICRTQIGMKEGDTPYQTLAKEYRKEAIGEMIGWKARIDTGVDGVPEWELR